MAHTNGARRISIRSTDNFKTCSMGITYGKKSGQITFRVIGTLYELMNTTVESSSCVARQGNAFGTSQ
jgi:hypothetical protein